MKKISCRTTLTTLFLASFLAARTNPISRDIIKQIEASG